MCGGGPGGRHRAGPTVRQLVERRLRPPGRRHPDRRRGRGAGAPAGCRFDHGRLPTFDGVVGPGQAARIMTGAPMPARADAVCMLEDCQVEEDGEVVVIDQPVAAGEAVRGVGEDVAVGEVLADTEDGAHPGPPRGPGQPGNRRGRWSIPGLGSGSCPPATNWCPGAGPLAPGQIRDANRHTLLALVRREGWDAGRPGDGRR